MCEGDSEEVFAEDGGLWLVQLHQICTARGWSLASGQFSGKHLVLPGSAASAKAEELARSGVVVLRGDEGALSPAEVHEALEATMSFVAEVVPRIGQEVARNPKAIIRFADVVARTSHRLNVKPPALWDTSRFSFLHEGSAFHEVLKASFGTDAIKLTHCGALVARPAPDGLPNNINQDWHRDAPEEPALSQKQDPFAVVVYIPLVDMFSENGATEFLVGSHRDGTDPARLRECGVPEDRVASTAGLRAGDIVIFDCRTCHRGMLHTATSKGIGPLALRPVLALNFGVLEWNDKEDSNNWGTEQLVP